MTADEFPHTIKARIVEIAKVISAVSIIIGFFGGAWSVTYGPARELLNQWEDTQRDIADLKRRMATVQGEDRVIREVPGMTYVSKPVYQNENIIFNMVAERTRLGEKCILEYSQPIFTDKMNVPTPGGRRLAARQISNNPTPLRPGYEPPDNLHPGRITVYLILAYECDGKTVFDQTSTAAFELIAGPRPAGKTR